MTIALPPGEDDDHRGRFWLTHIPRSEDTRDPHLRDQWRNQQERLNRYAELALHVTDRACPGVDADVRPPPFLHSVHARTPADDNIGGIAEHVLSHSEDCLITGEAGAGKTGILMSIMRKALTDWRLLQSRWLPVYVLATDLAATRSLERALSRGANQELAPGAGGRTWRTEFFSERPTSTCRWLVLVDGLDEVLSAEHRQRILRTIAAGSAGGRYRFVVAARSLAHQDRVWQWTPVTYEMRPLNDAEFAAFARKWFTAFGVEDPARTAEEFVVAVNRVGIDRSLARNPLMATMLCQIYRRRHGTALPVSRYEIYDEFIDVMYERMPGDPNRQTGINEEMSRALAIYGERAVDRGVLLLERLPETVLELAYIQESHQRRKLLDVLENDMKSLRKNVDRRTWRRLLVDTSQRTGLLTRHRENGLRFVHDTFADFLAARYVAEHPLLHKTVLRRLFGWFGFANPETAPPFGGASQSHTSFVRFLFGAAEQRERTEKALTRLVSRRGLKGLAGAEFAATLHADGVLAETVRAATVAALLSRTSGNGNRQDRDHAEQLLARLGCARAAECHDHDDDEPEAGGRR